MINDCLVLVTRPDQVAQETISQIAGWGADVCHAPVFTVHPVENKIDDIGEMDTLIFVSRHAVRYSTELIASCARKLESMDILAVGPATAELLKTEYGCTVSIPEQGVGGKALLASFDSDYWRNRKVGVVRSLDAPTELIDALAGLDAKVRAFNVYRRQFNPMVKSILDRFIAAPQQTKIVTGYSSDSLSALQGVATDNFSKLAVLPLLVVSSAIAHRAIELSWSGPIEIAKSTDESELRVSIDRLIS